jgi:hypothetical protein
MKLLFARYKHNANKEENVEKNSSGRVGGMRTNKYLFAQGSQLRSS